MSITNSSLMEPTSSSPLTTETVITAIFMIAVSVIATFGNGLVIAAVLWNRRLRTATNFLFLNLAVADFFQGMVAMPLRLAEVLNTTDKHPLIPCLVVVPLTVFFFGASNLNMTLISTDRFVALYWSFLYPVLATPKNLFLIIMSLWAFMLTLALFPVFGVGRASMVETTNICLYTTTFSEEYLYTMFSLVNFGVMVVLAVTNVYILKTARRQIRRIQVLGPSNVNQAHGADQSHYMRENSNDNEPEETLVKISDKFSHNSNGNPKNAASNNNTGWFTHKYLGNHLRSTNRVSAVNNEILEVSAENLDSNISNTKIDTTSNKSKRPRISINTFIHQKPAISRPSVSEVINTNQSIRRRNPRKQTMHKERRATKTVLVIVGLFVVCTTPITVIDIISLCGCVASAPPTVIKIFVCLAYSNACVNVFVYAGYKKDMTDTWIAMYKRLKAVLCKHR